MVTKLGVKPSPCCSSQSGALVRSNTTLGRRPARGAAQRNPGCLCPLATLGAGDSPVGSVVNRFPLGKKNTLFTSGTQMLRCPQTVRAGSRRPARAPWLARTATATSTTKTRATSRVRVRQVSPSRPPSPCRRERSARGFLSCWRDIFPPAQWEVQAVGCLKAPPRSNARNRSMKTPDFNWELAPIHARSTPGRILAQSTTPF